MEKLIRKTTRLNTPSLQQRDRPRLRQTCHRRLRDALRPGSQNLGTRGHEQKQALFSEGKPNDGLCHAIVPCFPPMPLNVFQLLQSQGKVEMLAGKEKRRRMWLYEEKFA